MHRVPYWRLSGYYFFYFAYVGAFSPYFGLYLKSLSFSAWDISVLMTQMQLMRLCGPYFWGAFVDRVGHRVRVIRATGLVTLAVYSIFFISTQFSALWLAMTLFSFFWVAALPLVETLTFDHLKEQADKYSQIRLWGSIGFIIAVMVTGVVLDHFGTSKLLWSIMATLGGIALCAWVLPEVEADYSKQESLPVGEIVRQPAVKALLAACFSMSAAHGALYIFLSIYLTEHGYSKLMAGSLWSLGVIAEIGVFMAMRHILQRVALKTILIICFAVAAIRFLLIGFYVDSLLILIFAQAMHGLTFGAYHSAAIAVVNQYFAGKTRSRGQALYSSVSFGAGGLVGGLVAGWAWDSWGGIAAFSIGSLFGLIGLWLVMKWLPSSPSGASSRFPLN